MQRRSGGQGQALVELVEVVAKALVDQPEKVDVQRVRAERQTRIELTVDPDDIGKVIGKDGRTAKSIRLLLSCAASKLGAGRTFLDILD